MRIKSFIKTITKGTALFVTILLVTGAFHSAEAQFRTNWLSAGSLHNWYSEVGSEIEHGLRSFQQFGMRYPGIYPYQDMQAAKALWIGTRNFTDTRGEFWDRKVVHVGPRVSGANVFFPIEFTTIGRFDQPIVFVDGDLQYSESPMDIDEVDPTIPSDVLLYNKVNTQIGLTMEREIMQFSRDYHDNYHLMVYTFTNTGNVDDTPGIELPDQTLEDVVIFFQHRLSAVRETRYLIGNHTGWGRNTMNDARGDGRREDPPDEQFRASFSWHGYDPTKIVPYDNLGAPIFYRDDAGYISVGDTVGRLGAPHHGGMLTIHVDTSPTDKTDDRSQPSLVDYSDSDYRLNSGNDPYNPVRMREEYRWMTEGGDGMRNARHAWQVEPSGDFAAQTANPALGSSGGWSLATGYGPFTLGPGESIQIIAAEGVGALSREEATRIGRMYKRGQISDHEKNMLSLTSRDSLFQTFRRAIANYESGYNIPSPPMPPSILEVNSGGDRINLDWDVYPEATGINGFKIYRATGRSDSTYYLIHEAGPNERSFEDRDRPRGTNTPEDPGGPIRGLQYFYYIVSVGDPAPGADPMMAPPGNLVSSRYWTQTYDPAYLRRAPGESMADIRVVPNPYSIAQNETVGWDVRDRLAFLNIPGECTIKIYSELGELIETIKHTDGSGDEFWDITTSSRQVVVSGIYIAVIEDHQTGERAIRKFVVIR